MANKKLSQLTPVTSLASSDLVYVVTDTATTPVSKGITAENLTAAVSTSSVSINPVENEYANVAAMIADQANQTLNFFEFVQDTEAYYEYLGTTTPSIADYRLLSESEVLTVTGNNGYKNFKLKDIQNNATPLSNVDNGAIGIEYDNGTDAVTGVLLDKSYTKIIQRYVDLAGSLDYYIKIYNRGQRNYQVAKVTGFATVNTNHTLVSIDNTINRTVFTLGNELEVLFDVDVAGGSNAVLDRTGTALTFDSDAYYNKDTYLTTGDLTLSDTGGVNGKTGVIWCNGYIPNISGLTHLKAQGNFLDNKLNIASFNYVDSTNYKAELRIANIDNLSPPLIVSTPEDTQIVLTWTAITDANNYVIERSLDNFATLGTQIYTGSLLTFTDTGLTNGTTYYYRGVSQGSGKIPSGNGLIASSEAGSSFDTDAQAFIDAVGGLNTINENAVNQLVLDVKAIGASEAVWNKIICLNVKAGTTQAQHKWNLKDPRDLDAAYRFTYSGTWTHTANGAQCSTTASADTKVNLSTLSLSGDFAMGSYINLTPTLTGDKYIMGANQNSRTFAIRNITASGIVMTPYGSSSATIDLSDSLKTGFLSMSVISTDKTLFYNSDTPVTQTAGGGGNVPNFNIFEGMLNLNGSPYGGVGTRFGTSFYSEGLTNSEMASFKTAIITYETSLSRNV